MAELLGQAVLELRTDDTAFAAGVSKAEAAANGLGKTLDACSGSSVKLAAELTEAAQSGNRGAQAWLSAGTAIERLAAAQVEAETETNNAKAALAAGTITLEAYNQQVLETKAGLALFEEEHRKAQAELRKTIAATKEATETSGAQRQGLIQLTQQLGDASTMYALGARPAQIFASQIGQAAGAVQLLAGESSKFALFLRGPWGIGITGAIMVLGPLIGTLLQTETEMHKVELASDGLADAQGVLGKMFDLTTGKLKHQNEELRTNAEAIAINLRGAAALARQRSNNAFGNFETGNLGLSTSQKVMGALGVPVGEAMQREQGVRDLVSDIRSGKVQGADAIKRAEKLNFDGLAINRTDFIQAIVDLVSSPSLDKTANAVEKSLADGVLDPSLRQPATKKNHGKTLAEIDAEFVQKIDGLNRDELQARLALATDAGDRLEIQKELLNNDRDAKIAEIERNKDFTAAQKAAMKAYIDRLYGRSGEVGADGQIVVDGKPGLLSQAAMLQYEAEQARLTNDMLQRQAETAQAWAQVIPSTRERARLEAEALKLQQQIQTNLLEQQIATGQIKDAAKARAELSSQQAAARKGLSQRTAGPIDQYADQLTINEQESGRRVEALMVQELDYVHQSITESISARLGVEDPLLKGLIDMFVEQVFVRPMAEALRNASSKSGGGGGGLGSLLSSIFGGGGSGAAPSALLLSSASATVNDPQFAGLFASGGVIPDGAWGIVGDAGPEPIRSTAAGIEVLPNSSLRALGGNNGGRPGQLHVTISGARGNAEIQQMVREGIVQGLAAYDTGVAGRVRDQMDRRS